MATKKKKPKVKTNVKAQKKKVKSKGSKSKKSTKSKPKSRTKPSKSGSKARKTTKRRSTKSKPGSTVTSKRRRPSKRPRKKTQLESSKTKSFKAKGKRRRKSATSESGDNSRRERQRVEVVSYLKGSELGIDNGVLQTSRDHVSLSSHFNKEAPTGEVIAKVFDNAFRSHLSKGPFEADEVLIYKYGIHIRPLEGKVTPEIEARIRNVVNDYGAKATIMVVQETEKIDSVYIKLGGDTPGLAKNIKQNLIRQGDLWQDIWAIIDEEFDESHWMVEWDVEEAMY